MSNIDLRFVLQRKEYHTQNKASGTCIHATKTYRWVFDLFLSQKKIPIDS